MIIGAKGMVVAGHPLASAVGIQVLEEGGNAVDAALATAFVMAVVKPETCGPGGDVFALIHMRKEGRVQALNASGPAPSEATIDFFERKGIKRIPLYGGSSIAVPGAVDGWLELHRRYGGLELGRLLEPAIDYARDGFPLQPPLAQAIADLTGDFPDIEACYMAPLRRAGVGQLLIQSALGDTFERIVREGRRGFYEGPVAAGICRAARAADGVLREKDFEGNFAEWLEPLASTYRGLTLYEQPPVSQGFLVLEMLNIVEADSLASMAAENSVHLMVEAKKLAFADRIAYLEDPRFGNPRVSLLISKRHAAARRALIGGRAEPRSAGEPSLGGDTTYLCAADRDGNVVSLIQSIFSHFGSGVIARNSGVIMNNRLASFGLDPKKANALKPGKRPAHTLNSYMVFKEGEFWAVGGSPGADDQPQTNFQVLHHLIDRDMDPQAAVEAPRWSHEPGTPPREEGQEQLRLEPGFDADLARALSEKGHNVKLVKQRSFGSAKVIVKEPSSGVWMAGADPRREAYAVGR
jgi:gamma-glutamyltranspeptidase/glutathione hydrolase